MLFTDPRDLLAYIPTDGSPGPPDSDLINPTETDAGVFGGEVAVLKLNIDFSDAGVLRGNLGIPFGDLVLGGFSSKDKGGLVALEPLDGAAVRRRREHLARRAAATAPFTIADLFPIAQDINDSFVDGTPSAFATEHLIAPPAPPFQITSMVRTNATDLLITWNTTGATNIVQVAAGTGASGSFSTNGFTDLATVVVTTYTTNFWDVGAATNKPARYYRIRSPQ